MSDNLQYSLIRSNRKSISVEIQRDGTALVRAPRWSPKFEIDAFVLSHEEWIREQQAKMAIQFIEDAWTPKLTTAEIKSLAKTARLDIKYRIERWAPIVAPDSAWANITDRKPRLSIRHQKTLWGSCTREGNLNFNCLLMLAPEDVRDYIVVHELCHLKHMNHSRAFWNLVERAMPNYREQKKWLKENGHLLLARLD